jgi:hypothetical protein
MEEEEDDFVECIDCGDEVLPGAGRAYSISPELVLCFDCAVARGGEYDERLDRWVKDPDLRGEPDERRPHP